jgi:hypothetical protein
MHDTLPDAAFFRLHDAFPFKFLSKCINKLCLSCTHFKNANFASVFERENCTEHTASTAPCRRRVRKIKFCVNFYLVLAGIATKF